MSDEIFFFIEKKTEILIKQTNINPRKTLIFQKHKTFFSATSLKVEKVKWLLGLTNLEVYSSISTVTKKTIILHSLLLVKGLIL